MNNNLSLLKIINGLSKTINVANQLIPLYSQIKPLITSTNKSITNIKNNLKDNISPPKIENIPIKKEANNNLPTFFQ